LNNDGYHAGIGITPRKSTVYDDFDATVLFDSGRLATTTTVISGDSAIAAALWSGDIAL
jgi:hypothetical protein